VVCADGGYGYPEAAPYDRIILMVGAADVLPAWMEQGKPGGRLVLPLRIVEDQQSVAFEKTGDHLVSRLILPFGFMMLPGAFTSTPHQNIPLGGEPGLILVVEEGAPEVELLSLSAMFPESVTVELASIVLIFTSQAWNLTFAWYQSLSTTPRGLREASSIFRFN
jgi:hypothetical protein